MRPATRPSLSATQLLRALCAAAATLAFPAAARAANEALLIGAPPADAAALTRLWDRLETGFGFSEVRIATAASPHEIGKQLRRFLGAPGEPNDLRLVWIAGPGAGAADPVCPPWSEDFVRPQVPAIVVAPSCIKFLVQAPSTYEPLAAADGAAPPAGPRGVVFVSTTQTTPEDTGDGPADLLGALSAPAAVSGNEPASQALIRALACAAKGKVSLDFAPSSSAWHLVPPLCDETDASAAPAAESPSPADVEDGAAGRAAPMPPPPRPDAEAATTAGAGAPDMPAVPVTPVTAAPLAEPGVPAFSSPVDGATIAADFGPQAGGKANKGIDFAAAPGTPVKAAEAGQVVYVGKLPGYGQVVAIKHDNDWATVYGHTSSITVTKGQTVAKGQDIAKIDSASGRLHFEIRRRGKPVDPRPMLASAGP